MKIKIIHAIIAVAASFVWQTEAQTSVSQIDGRPYTPPPDPRVVAAQIQARAAAETAAQAQAAREHERQAKEAREATQKNLEYDKQVRQQTAAQAQAQRRALLNREAATLLKQRNVAIEEIENEASPVKAKLAGLNKQLEIQGVKSDNSGLKEQIEVYSMRAGEYAKKIAAVNADYRKKLAALPDELPKILLREKAEQKKIESVKTIEWLKGRAANGEASAQCSLGIRYLHGDGVDQDKDKARDYLKAAANQGNSEAITALNELDASSK